jgi:hypothetical protein
MFQLTKVWVDPNDRVDSVEIRYTWSAIGEPATWRGDDEAEVMSIIPGTTPRVRQAAIEIPRYLDSRDNYLLHYQFGGGGEHHEGFSQIYTEEIVAHEVDYVDAEGLVTEVRVLWAVGGWSAPNWSQARLEGLALAYDKDQPGHDQEGEGIADEAMYEMVQTVPLPRRYVGKVWGPRGATVEYSILLLRTDTPAGDDEFEKWDNNGGRNYSIVLS